MSWEGNGHSTATRNGSSGEIHDRQPPHDLDSEAGALAAILTHPPAIADAISAGLRPNHFYDQAHRIVFAAMEEISVRDAIVDPTLLLPILRRSEDKLGTRAEALLVKLIGSPGLVANLPHYVNQVLDTARRRNFILTLDQLHIDAVGGRKTSDILETAARQIEQLRVGTDIIGQTLTYRRLTCAELDATEFEVDYLIDWTLVAGQPCIMAGPKKALKTSILLDLAFALAIGGYFLGLFRVSRAVRVCMMSGESGMATIQETLRRIAAAAGKRLGDIGNLILSDQLPLFGDLRHLDALRKFLTDDEIAVLILDPAYLCVPTGGNEGSLFAVGELLRSISELCQSMGVTLILAHHTKKGVADEFATPELENISWAGFQEFARQWILLGRRERFEPGSGNHKLWMNVGGSAGHSALWAVDVDEGSFDGSTPRHWQVNVVKASDARKDAAERKESEKLAKVAEKRQIQLDADKQALIKAIGTQIDTATSFRDPSGIHTSRYNATVAALFTDGAIVKAIVTKNGRQFDAIRLKPDTAESGIGAIGAASVQTDEMHVCTDGGSSVQCSVPIGDCTCTDAIRGDSTDAPGKKRRKKKCTDGSKAKRKATLRVHAPDDSQQDDDQ